MGVKQTWGIGNQLFYTRDSRTRLNECLVSEILFSAHTGDEHAETLNGEVLFMSFSTCELKTRAKSQKYDPSHKGFWSDSASFERIHTGPKKNLVLWKSSCIK